MDGFTRDLPLWVNTFDGLSSGCEVVDQLCEGVLLSEIMKQISPDYFDYDVNHGSSWAGHKMNNALLVKGLEDYYRSVHGKEFILDFVDLDRLSQERDLAELSVLCEFVVGAAVQCPEKQRYINNIMSMSEESQGTLMNLAKALMQRAPNATAAAGGYAEEEEEEVAVSLLDRIASLEKSNAQLEKFKDEAESKAKLANDEVEVVRHTLQQRFDEVQQGLVAKNTELAFELDSAQEREGELRKNLAVDYDAKWGKDSLKWEKQVTGLEEEKDILVAKVEDYAKIKNQAERMREKIDEMDAGSMTLKERLVLVEESNAKRLDRILELEGLDSDRDFNKKKTEQYKAATKDLELKVLKMSSEVAVKDEEIAHLSEELKDTQEKCHYFESELEATKQELRRQLEQEGGGEGGGALNGLGNNSADFVTPELKEKITRLERENETLKVRVDNPSSSGADAAKIEILSNELSERERKCGQVEREAQKLKRDVEKLGLERGQDAAAASERSDVRAKGLEEQLVAAQSKVSDREALTQTVSKLEEIVKKRGSENSKLAADKEKLESYTKKALHNVQDKYTLAIKTCKEQLTEKDQRIQRLTEQYKQYRQQSQREAQLMSSAVYELGMSITEQRLVRNLDRSGNKPSNQPTWIQEQRDIAKKGSLQGGV